ncbi:DUF1338 domain-containing protein [Amphritea sp. 1_MG-2023]|uniref:DUF1338 domain-containing protein n=1 Tax=Amphritea sp. 1_MG-2023 TaxID=3062670 RepID=UPI0026E1BF84|nr:DUF1338 domain-containing protein [Amphritea sp. 1_MG-2023]MDO6564333.1 DUF1338 domain-containing protein [Amphritea sp. 1_MG-2023]
MHYDSFFNLLWEDYVKIAPQARQIHDLFTRKGEQVFNDHVAFRTFSNSPIDLLKLEPVIFDMGYTCQQHYHFEKKKLMARSYSHRDPLAPKIFLSELQRHLLSAESQQILANVVAQISTNAVTGPETFAHGLFWNPVSFADYSHLSSESEYAAWLTCMGLRVNHFTVCLNHLKNLTSMEKVIALLEENGFAINQVGGAIKGVPADLLVQASTLADQIEVTFGCGHTTTVPSCFYEFAKRYKNAEGKLFDGFITNNADKIFESTHRA